MCLLGYPTDRARILVYKLSEQPPIRNSIPGLYVPRQEPGIYLGEVAADSYERSGWNSIVLFGDVKAVCMTPDLKPYKIEFKG